MTIKANTGVLCLLIAASFYQIFAAEQKDLAKVFAVAIGVLVFFTVLTQFVLREKNATNSELSARTTTFWWMLAFFMVSAASNAMVFSVLLGSFCLAAFYEYMQFASSPATKRTLIVNVLCALLIPIAFTLSYLERNVQATYVCMVFLLLIVPVLLVVENTKDGQLKRFGHLTSSSLFFAYTRAFLSGYCAGLSPYGCFNPGRHCR